MTKWLINCRCDKGSEGELEVPKGVKKGFLERVTFKVRLMGRWDLAGPGDRGRGVQVESVVDIKFFVAEGAE